MKPDADGARGGRGWIRGALIGAQIALCTMLLIPAGLLARALHAAHNFDAGFDHQQRRRGLDRSSWSGTSGASRDFSDQWFDRVRALPGVERLAQTSRVPLSPGRSQATFRVGDEPEGQVVEVNTVSPDFFCAARHADRSRPRVHRRRG